MARIVHIAPSDDFLSRWADDLELSREMYREADIEVTSYAIERIDIENAGITIAPGGFFRTVLSRLLGL